MARENDNEANEGSIGGVAKQCRARFEECLHLQPLVQYEWAENRLAEFNLWAAGTGAFAGERASLDSRLAHQPDTRDFVINILSLLQGCIEKCRDVALGLPEEAIFKDIPTLGTSDPAGHTGTETPEPPELIPRSFSPWSDMSSTDSWPEETPAGALDLSSSSCATVQYEVEQVLDSLTRIAVVIRKSGANFRNQKADRLFDPKAHQKLRSHLEILVLARGSKTGRDRWDVDARDLTPIQERLMISNLRRRNRFVYAQRHAQKLGIDAEKAHSNPEPSRDDSPMTVDKITPQTQITVPESPALPLGLDNTPGASSAIMSATTASAVDSQIEERHDDTIREDQHQTLTASAAVLAPSGLSSCPLCDETDTADSERLLDHVLEHVHEFSMRSLPWPTAETGDDENRVWDYFRNNDYFDEGTDGQSSRLTVSDASDQDLAGLASLPSNGSFAPSDVENIYPDSAGDHGFQYTAKSMSFDEAAMTKRQELLEDLRNKILACRRGENASAIVCFSDLKDVYKGRLQDIQAIARLTTEQATEVLTQMLKLFSFFVILPAPLEWFDQFQSLFFAGASHSSFQDKHMPLHKALAANLKLEHFLYRWPEQYLLIPAVIDFGTDKPQIITDKRIRLPYLESPGNYDGGFGGVKCWMLAPEHIDRGETQYKNPVAAAVKTFIGLPNEVGYKQILKKRLTGVKGLSLHQAILGLANGEIKIFLPWPEHGSLDTFLSGGQNPSEWNAGYYFPAAFPRAEQSIDRLATALLKQCFSVAGAMKFLHDGFPGRLDRYYCVCMDLKPDNILIFQGSAESMVGTWKITDFSISVIKHWTDPVNFVGTVGDLFRKYTVDTEASREQGAYTPPEVLSTTSRDSRRLGRGVDVWAFGAIFAEVLAFTLGHAPEVDRLTAIRRAGVSVVADDYFYSRKSSASLAVPGQQAGELQFELKPGVQDWLFECVDKWSEDRLYVKYWVRCISRALSVDHERRPTATQLLDDVGITQTSAFTVVGEDLPS
ncbi:hypothetical protein PFICI_14069 [Pestalotiopsis fici W106-1]|uniref:Protein kinase domain-containing protein n=1 Tax=Pestalotiopsis fici (strain W106-1 / CGMCC3.15140) TaxID=1229662 RepID=W3WK08_PESFW|nr:uncharacterized protein PFICI_14069 [Pestalotiopsis fici W106-1]ETS74203.1 hypothetical protein PFICI_14069 [Pestalotiopsis fici W106-1]